MSCSFLLPLSIVPIFLPIFSGYTMGVLLLIWLGVSGEWRGLFDYFFRTKSNDSNSSDQECLFKDISRGLLCFFICIIVSMILAHLFSNFSTTIGKTFKEFFHLFLKHFLLWFALAGGVVALYRRGLRPSALGRWFVIVLSIHLIYVLTQRYTGIDLVHGFGATLPPNRFAYGVYRVSGFMSHPLTLAYNLGLVMLVSGYFAFTSVAHRKTWLVVLTLSFLNILFTGSRWPLAAVFMTFFILSGIQSVRNASFARIIYRYKWYIVFCVAIISLGVWLEGSIISRMHEVFDPNVPLTKRFPRLVFWAVHWQMFLDHPWYGVGLPGMEQALEAYYQAFPAAEEKYSAHNIFLQTMADFGSIGVAGLFLFLGSMYRAAKRAEEKKSLINNSLGIKLFLLATIIFALFQNTLRDSEYLYSFWLLLSFILIDTSNTSENT